MTRIALILPEAYRGGTLRWLRHMALMLRKGAQNQGIELQVVVCALRGHYNLRETFKQLRQDNISIRPFAWKEVHRDTAEEMMSLAAVDPEQLPEGSRFSIPDDGHNNLLDCDYWLVISDRVPHPLVPMRPYAVYVADALQRYVPDGFSSHYKSELKRTTLPLLRHADCLMTTTPVATEDCHCYFGVPFERIVELPMAIESHFPMEPCLATPATPYFVWLTNCSPHKNHALVLDALESYYATSRLRLKAFIMGTLTDAFRSDCSDPQWQTHPVVSAVRSRIAHSPLLAQNVVIGGELPEMQYNDAIRRGEFLLNANRYDNGCFATIDSVYLRRPVLCSSYPAQRYINERFQLNGVFFDPLDSQDLKNKLLEMDRSADSISLPAIERLEAHTWNNLADEVFSAVGHRLRKDPGYAYH